MPEPQNSYQQPSPTGPISPNTAQLGERATLYGHSLSAPAAHTSAGVKTINQGIGHPMGQYGPVVAHSLSHKTKLPYWRHARTIHQAHMQLSRHVNRSFPNPTGVAAGAQHINPQMRHTGERRDHGRVNIGPCGLGCHWLAATQSCCGGLPHGHRSCTVPVCAPATAP